MSIWGKVIGGVTGFAIGGPIGAIIGAVAGHHVVDRKADPMAKIGNAEKQVAFTTAVIVLAAKMAKADGHVRSRLMACKEEADAQGGGRAAETVMRLRRGSPRHASPSPR